MQVIKLGSKGQDVVTLQNALSAIGFYKGKVDGLFGPQTKQAVIDFQIAKELVVDGIVGKQTWTFLNIDNTPIDNDGSTPWLDWLIKFEGEKEIPGSKDNPWITELFSKYTSYGRTDADETPWCAATVCAALQETGYKNPRRADVLGFRNYGKVSTLIQGALVGLRWSSGSRHITTVRGGITSTHFNGIGGNQSNMLNTTKYPRSSIEFIRWPVKP